MPPPTSAGTGSMAFARDSTAGAFAALGAILRTAFFAAAFLRAVFFPAALRAAFGRALFLVADFLAGARPLAAFFLPALRLMPGSPPDSVRLPTPARQHSATDSRMGWGGRTASYRSDAPLAEGS